MRCFGPPLAWSACGSLVAVNNLHKRNSLTPQPHYIAGLGCRRDCSMQQLLTLLEQSLSAQQLSISQLSALASSAHKQHEAGLLQLAIQLRLPLRLISAAELARQHPRLSQHCALSLQITGSAGVAQASALACAEQLYTGVASLLGERSQTSNATCAIAHIFSAESL